MLLSLLLNLIEKDYEQVTVWMANGKYFASLVKEVISISASGDTAEEAVQKLLAKLANE